MLVFPGAQASEKAHLGMEVGSETGLGRSPLLTLTWEEQDQ